MYRRPTGPPAWFVTLIAFALVFAVYYLYTGFLGWMERGGQSPEEATAQAALASTARAEERIARRTPSATPRPSATPVPECQMFRVSAQSANMRRQPSLIAQVIRVLPQNTEVCVLARQGDWYQIDADPITRRIEEGYMSVDVLRPLNPTATPVIFTPPPTITLTPSETPTRTPRP
ncbi:MAG: SH3 domain-containing protein [Anaerolineae bacterium]|nr:SH3 domain-containing protein [Anaerolineae bacterium]MDW8173017.1 SH3 domain-containing protein [Anaerolineae bacterium]